MNFQFNIFYISTYLAIALTACTSTTSPVNNEVISNHNGLHGEWIEIISNKTNNMVHTLDFNEDLLTETLVHQNKSSVCGNGPELYKQFKWQKMEGSQTLILTVERHFKCGNPNSTGQKLKINYYLKGNTLQIFDSSWKRKR